MHCTLALLYFNNNYKSTTAQCRHSQEKILDIPACAQEQADIKELFYSSKTRHKCFLILPPLFLLFTLDSNPTLKETTLLQQLWKKSNQCSRTQVCGCNGWQIWGTRRAQSNGKHNSHCNHRLVYTSKYTGQDFPVPAPLAISGKCDVYQMFTKLAEIQHISTHCN